MKGKVAFVLGAAVGYVLGTRAGRERYAQIKRGATQVWESAPVQSAVDAVNGAVGAQIDRVKVTLIDAGKRAFTAVVSGTDAKTTAPADAQAPAKAQSQAAAADAAAAPADKPAAEQEAM
ncbi:YtxH domain-containing protein [Leucobacter sp. cx-42]|uniref:YtxH domain-containing protein n=1 Tax=unclassified Leucobacter TaxID=2621730 RepID=UPI00165D3AAA|nr:MULTISPECIES: YtxH domain-containing protein [unclassified Leucobacter]MBC9955126.1 YtxH domain-containing protein [Leucobacter sp. cx-42]